MQQHSVFWDISGKLPPTKKTVRTVTYMIQFVHADSCSLYKEHLRRHFRQYLHRQLTMLLMHNEMSAVDTKQFTTLLPQGNPSFLTASPSSLLCAHDQITFLQRLTLSCSAMLKTAQCISLHSEIHNFRLF
jgi:hypothetical protein